MKKQFDPLEQILMTAAKTVDKSLLLAFQKEMMKRDYLSEKQLDRIADKVLSRISIRLEDEAIKQLRDLLRSLGQ